MASTYTQFARNALCLGKTFLPATHFLRTLALPAAPAPLDSVSLIELAVAVTQFAGLGFFVQSGMARILSGSSGFLQSKKSLSTLDRLSVLSHPEDSHEIDQTTGQPIAKKSPFSSSYGYTLLRQFLLNKNASSARTKIVGFCHFFVATAFLVLFTNTLHFKLPGHPTSVINAVLLLEIGLAYMLTTVFRSGKESYQNYKNTKTLINLLEKENLSSLSNQKLIEVASSTGFVDNLMEIYCQTNNFSPTASCSELDLKNDLNVLSENLKMTQDPSLLNKLYNKSNEYFFDSIITFLFFGLNFIAGYGYFLIILDYYFPQASLKGKGFFNMLAKLLMFNQDGETASFWGGVAGDAAWTIEPLLDLSLPHLRKTFIKKRQHQKSD